MNVIHGFNKVPNYKQVHANGKIDTLKELHNLFSIIDYLVSKHLIAKHSVYSIKGIAERIRKKDPFFPSINIFDGLQKSELGALIDAIDEAEEKYSQSKSIEEKFIWFKKEVERMYTKDDSIPLDEKLFLGNMAGVKYKIINFSKLEIKKDEIQKEIEKNKKDVLVIRQDQLPDRLTKNFSDTYKKLLQKKIRYIVLIPEMSNNLLGLTRLIENEIRVIYLEINRKDVTNLKGKYSKLESTLLHELAHVKFYYKYYWRDRRVPYKLIAERYAYIQEHKYLKKLNLHSNWQQYYIIFSNILLNIDCNLEHGFPFKKHSAKFYDLDIGKYKISNIYFRYENYREIMNKYLVDLLGHYNMYINNEIPKVLDWAIINNQIKNINLLKKIVIKSHYIKKGWSIVKVSKNININLKYFLKKNSKKFKYIYTNKIAYILVKGSVEDYEVNYLKTFFKLRKDRQAIDDLVKQSQYGYDIDKNVVESLYEKLAKKGFRYKEMKIIELE